MAIHQDGAVVTCAVDYEGRFSVGNIRDLTIREAWWRLGEAVRQPHRERRWVDLPDVCRGCGDWQVAGAEYEDERVEGTRPFWYQRTGRGREPRSERS
jgi:radical SAM protein with 4Fe4S-binding SPASM domain